VVSRCDFNSTTVAGAAPDSDRLPNSPVEPPRPTAVHSEFLRTGRIIRNSTANWLAEERRYLSYDEVAEKTARKLQAAGEKTHDR
jgi:hypothetical protein